MQTQLTLHYLTISCQFWNFRSRICGLSGFLQEAAVPERFHAFISGLKRSTFKLLEKKQNNPTINNFWYLIFKSAKETLWFKGTANFHIFRMFGFGLLPSSPHDAEASGAWPYAGHPPRKISRPRVLDLMKVEKYVGKNGSRKDSVARTDTPFSCEFMVGVETAVDRHRISHIFVCSNMMYYVFSRFCTRRFAKLLCHSWSIWRNWGCLDKTNIITALRWLHWLTHGDIRDMRNMRIRSCCTRRNVTQLSTLRHKDLVIWRLSNSEYEQWEKHPTTRNLEVFITFHRQFTCQKIPEIGWWWYLQDVQYTWWFAWWYTKWDLAEKSDRKHRGADLT